jgi:hypothetical protein
MHAGRRRGDDAGRGQMIRLAIGLGGHATASRISNEPPMQL